MRNNRGPHYAASYRGILFPPLTASKRSPRPWPHAPDHPLITAPNNLPTSRQTIIAGTQACSVSFIANLMVAGVEFVACDMPAANCLTLNIMAADGDAEAWMIFERTLAALAAAKA